ncbi:hypothetical protein ILYODFUR_014970 [Ilyodon furcidens]|uniref:Uncharacterized protein n=1 Tax=Ilyodon furcidens TaxID=33524 RepID=A0ABV0TUR6_9TELE
MRNGHSQYDSSISLAKDLLKVLLIFDRRRTTGQQVKIFEKLNQYANGHNGSYFLFLGQGDVSVYIFICPNVYFLSSEFVFMRKWILSLILDISPVANTS